MATGVVHSALVAPLIYHERWEVFVGRGFMNISPHSMSDDFTFTFSDIGDEAAIWFFAGGVLMFLVGQLMHSLEMRSGKLPPYLGWELLAIGSFFGWMVPQSGFTLLIIPQAVFILVRSR